MKTNTGNEAPSSKRYRVTDPHNYEDLKVGDIVTLAITPVLHGYTPINFLIRIDDMTLHPTKDKNCQFIHLETIDSE
jgi:hypothetical protein